MPCMGRGCSRVFAPSRAVCVWCVVCGLWCACDLRVERGVVWCYVGPPKHVPTHTHTPALRLYHQKNF